MACHQKLTGYPILKNKLGYEMQSICEARSNPCLIPQKSPANHAKIVLVRWLAYREAPADVLP